MQLKFTRKVDELGRIVLPMDLRKNLCFAKDQLLNITIDEDAIIIRKAVSNCELCGGTEALSQRGRFLLCEDCYQEISGHNQEE